MSRSGIPTADRAHPLAPSFTQEERLHAGGARPFSLSAVLKFEGGVEVGTMTRALGALHRRHENLRVSFRGDAGSFTAVIDEDQPVAVTVDAVPAGMGTEDGVRAALDLAAAHYARTFDLWSGPLFRALVVTIDDHTTLVSMVLDHIIADGWSVEILVEDLLAEYRALCAGGTAELPPLPYQFADFAQFEKRFLTGARFDQHLRYWTDKLRGSSPIPDSRLAGDRPCGGTPSAAQQRRTLDPAVRNGIADLAQRAQVSETAVFGAATKVAMYAMRCAAGAGADTDLGVMASAANRLHDRCETVVGYFATPIVLRTELDGDPSLATVIERESATLLQAMRYQAMPHALLLRALAPELYGARHARENGIVPAYVQFDVRFATAGSSTGAEVPGAVVSRLSLPITHVPRGGLRLIATVGQGRSATEPAAELTLSYRDDWYESAWAARFLDTAHRVIIAVTGGEAELALSSFVRRCDA